MVAILWPGTLYLSLRKGFLLKAIISAGPICKNVWWISKKKKLKYCPLIPVEGPFLSWVSFLFLSNQTFNKKAVRALNHRTRVMFLN